MEKTQLLSFLTGSGRGLARRRAAVLPALALTAGLGSAQAFVASTSSITDVAGLETLDDGSMVGFDGVQAPRQLFGEGQWQAVAGFIPSDIDGLGRRPGSVAGDWSEWVFSTLSDEAGFQDADVLGFAPGGGLEVVVAEDDLVAALGTASNIDIDGLAFDDQGRLHFSLQNGLAESVLGPVSDGDILIYDPLGFVTLGIDEAGVQARFEVASGTTSSIGDVQGVVWTADGYVVVTQGPSESDGAVLSIGSTPAFWHSEAAVGLEGAELDALAFFEPAEHAGEMWMSAHETTDGATVTARYSGGAPGANLMVAVSGTAGFQVLPGLAGFGALYFDLTDPFLNQSQLPLLALDAGGELELSFQLPPGAGGIGFGDTAGWTFQCVDLDRLMLSAPYRVAVD